VGLLCGSLLSGAIPKRFSPGIEDASADRGEIITLAHAREVAQKCGSVMRSAHNSALQYRKILVFSKMFVLFEVLRE
jgi:rRNA maturation protein Nop10